VSITVADRRLERAARRWSGDRRSAAQLREHYRLERALAQRLHTASAAERTALYAAAYDELFRTLPHHPQLQRRATPARAQQVQRELHFLAPLLASDMAVLELGAGDLELSRRLADTVREVHAVDVASAIATPDMGVTNLHIHLTDGRTLPLPDNRIALAYSNQLMEHLHPDDALAQLREVFRVLAPGGHYLCVTPNALTGPWDISRMFSPTPTGLHLHEYTNTELAQLLRAVGFRELRAIVPGPGRARLLPAWTFTTPERALQGCGPRLRRLLLAGPWRKPLHSIRLLAQKPAPS
jgi:ubiquinone/menaquinone biosynthesis C-methylase UbiE